MEKNHIVGFILIFATLMLWSIFTAPTEAELAESKRKRDSIEQSQIIAVEAVDEQKFDVIEKSVPQNDSLATLAANYAYGPFASASIGESEKISLENEEIKVSFDTKGGKVSFVDLKKYQSVTQDENHNEVKGPLHLLNNEKDKFDYFIPVSNLPSGGVHTSDLYFKPTLSGNNLSLKAEISTGGYVEQVYSLAQSGYKLDYKLNLVGLNNIIASDKNHIDLEWKVKLNKLEKSQEFEQRYSTVYFKENKEGNADYCKCISDDVEELEDSNIDWVSFSNQFFNTSLIANGKPFASGVMETVMTDVEKSDYLKTTSSRLAIPYGHGVNETFDMDMYLGPNEYKRLVTYDNGLEQIIPFGNSIFGSINRHVIRPFFNWLSSFISSKGIVIILMIFLVKMLLYPLMYKMLKSQALMGALKPQLAHLNDKYKDDAQKKQMETMKIYKEYGVSPFGGCLPMILQIPIWYALFRFFPASITFRQEPFLWASDLSSYDDFFHLPFSIPFVGDHLSLFTILYSVSMLIYTYYNTKHMDMSANPAMKYVQYLMPVMFFGFFNNYASGLTCYMFFSNMINISQTVITKKLVFDDDKLLAELSAKKAKPKKQSKFQQRLQQAMKEQQAKQAQMQKKRKK